MSRSGNPGPVEQLLSELAAADGRGLDVNALLYRRSAHYRRALDRCLAAQGWRVSESPDGLQLEPARTAGRLEPVDFRSGPCPCVLVGRAA